MRSFLGIGLIALIILVMYGCQHSDGFSSSEIRWIVQQRQQ